MLKLLKNSCSAVFLEAQKREGMSWPSITANLQSASGIPRHPVPVSGSQVLSSLLTLFRCWHCVKETGKGN